MDVLNVVELEKTYGRRKVVDGVSFRVGESEIVGLLGPNGAGKSTSFRMTCGLVIPDRGKILLDNQDVTDWPMYRRAKDGHMGYLAQESSVFRKLTVEQNITSMLELLGMPGEPDANAARSSWSSSTSSTFVNPERRSFRVANVGGWRSLDAWSPNHESSCSMNRLRGSIPLPFRVFKTSYCGFDRPGYPS